MPLSQQKRAQITARMQRLAWLLDARFALPGTGGKLRFGIDPLVGLIPGVGDAAMLLLSLYIVRQAWRLGTPRDILFQMIGWTILDFLIGGIPIAGDLADAVLKVNLRNLKLMGIEPKPPRAREPR